MGLWMPRPLRRWPADGLLVAPKRRNEGQAGPTRRWGTPLKQPKGSYHLPALAMDLWTPWHPLPCRPVDGLLLACGGEYEGLVDEGELSCVEDDPRVGLHVEQAEAHVLDHVQVGQRAVVEPAGRRRELSRAALNSLTQGEALKIKVMQFALCHVERAQMKALTYSKAVSPHSPTPHQRNESILSTNSEHPGREYTQTMV